MVVVSAVSLVAAVHLQWHAAIQFSVVVVLIVSFVAAVDVQWHAVSLGIVVVPAWVGLLSRVVVLLFVAFLAAADLVLVASSRQPVSLPRLVVDHASVGRQCLGVVCLLAHAVGDFVGIASDYPVVVGPWFEVPAVVYLCVSDYPAVVGPWFEVPAVVCHCVSDYPVGP